MPLDPSIISSYNPTPGIDVNALMTQRMQGMANINAMERQRQADALALEDRAAAQAKEQEDNAVKALLPAYAHALKTGDLDGALSLAPPEYQDSLTPYVDALRGKPLEEIQAALTGSLVTSDVGRAFLENQARMTTAGVQQGQLTLAQQRLAFDKEKAIAEAAGGGKVASSEVDAQGNKHFFDAYGNEIRVAQGVGKPAAATDTNGVKLKPDQRLRPDGTVELIPGTTTYNKQKSDFANDYKSAQASLQSINNLRTKVDALAKTTGFQKMMNTGAYMTAIPNTPLASLTGAYDFQSKFDDVVSAVNTFGREIASMSGKLGNMAVQEWKNVAGSVANMDPSKMSSADLDRQLESITTQLAIAENNVRNAYELEYGGGQFYTPLENQGATKTPGGEGTRPAGVGPDWTHMTDANGVGAWVSPDQKQVIEDQ